MCQSHEHVIPREAMTDKTEAGKERKKDRLDPPTSGSTCLMHCGGMKPVEITYHILQSCKRKQKKQ